MEQPSLTIVIPALNEEQAIGDTIARCLSVRETLKTSVGLAEVEIIVVSDGSTDRTAEIARSFGDVRVIEFERNRGYGAAIQEGWRQGTGTLLAFLDADGTCDPAYFEMLCRACLESDAGIALGSRLGPESRMPPIRRFGNRLYAILLGLLCGEHVTDTASGMRVVRRSALPQLLPLPTGLHFTPSMSARAMLNRVPVAEIPISYAERVGRSKLNVIRDGVRFLRTIVDAVLCYRPEKLFLMAFCLCALGIVILALNPTEFYVRNRRLEEWMIYRFVVSQLLASFGLLLLLAAALAGQLAEMGLQRTGRQRFWPWIVTAILGGRSLVVLMAFLFVSGVLFLWPGIVEFASTGGITLHWSRLMAGAFCLFSMLQTGVFGVLLRIAAIWKRERTLAEGTRELLQRRPRSHAARATPELPPSMLAPNAPN